MHTVARCCLSEIQIVVQENNWLFKNHSVLGVKLGNFNPIRGLHFTRYIGYIFQAGWLSWRQLVWNYGYDMKNRIYGLGIVCKCLGPKTYKGPTKDDCKVF